MSRISRVAARSLATLVAAGIGATMFTATATATATAPAQAASTAGGTITRSEVLARAQSWVDEGVPYNKGGCKTDANGTYREDCSGYVSMAWHLTSSLTTQSLPSVSTSFSDFSQLKPGDALDYTAEHTFLFANWTNKANGDFTYYAESNAHNPTRGPTSANINSSSLEGWPTSFYTGLRYKNIVDDKKPSSIGAYDPGTGTFYEGNQAGATLGSAKFGNPEWKPLAGDWNGTGTSKVGAYDPSTATFYLSNDNANTTTTVKFGNPGWIPLVGDWNGTGSDKVGAYDPSTATFYLSNDNANTTTTVKFGNPGWIPLVGDWNGTGTSKIGAYDPSTGTFYEGDQSGATLGSAKFGNPGWTPLAGDWTGRGTATVGAYDPNTGTFYLSNDNANSAVTTKFGNPGWTPIVGRW